MADTVETTHPSYAGGQEDWQTCRDVCGGAKAVKAAGVRYLPKLSEQTDEEYRAYVRRANFYNVFKRTVNGLTGTVFTRAPTLEGPALLVEDHKNDITLAGEPFELVARTIVADVLKLGRKGLLLDYSESQQRPFWILYEPEQIRDWEEEQRGGDTVLTWLVLKECEVIRTGFTRKETEQYRTFELVARAGAEPFCQVKLWQKVKREGQETWAVVKEFVPTRRGAPLPFIPFLTFNPLGITMAIASPPLLDLADVNLAHYRNSADHEHALHFTGVPTLFVRGVKTSGSLRIGSSEAIVAEAEHADAKFVEFTGQGLEPLARAMKEKEAEMTVLGSRLLETQKAAQEAAETVRMRHAGDNATLQDIVGSVALGLTVACRWHAYWAGASARPDDPAITVALNTDFMVTQPDLNALALLAQAGRLSQKTLYWNLERAGLTRPGVTVDQENEDIKAEGGDDQLGGGRQPPDNEDDDELDDVDDDRRARGAAAGARP